MLNNQQISFQLPAQQKINNYKTTNFPSAFFFFIFIYFLNDKNINFKVEAQWKLQQRML